MKKFFKNIILFLLLAMVIGEVVVRYTHPIADIPQRTIDKYGIQKYLPNQKGYWKGGKHKWVINNLGWPGELPQSYDNLILIIGDSFIENFMNPNECHQSSFLKKNLKEYNFMEAARSGVSLIESLEITEQFDSLKPIQTLIYVNDGDFYESVSDIKPISDITQLNINTNTIKYGELKSTIFKKVLYNWKLLYYFYNRFPLSKLLKTKVILDDTTKIPKDELESKTEITQLIAFIKNNYFIDNITLVFHPSSNESIIKLCTDAGFNIINLDSKNDHNWSFDFDSHWTCYGHERAAQQISRELIDNNTLNVNR